jgi:hypothetical protein
VDPCDIPIPAIQARCVAGDQTQGLVAGAASGVIGQIGESFANAAQSVLDATFETISQTTTVDLGAEFVGRNAAALTSLALVLIVGLMVIQAMTALLRQEPGGLVRAVTGAGVAILGTAAAVTVVQTLLVVIDELSYGIASMADTSIEDAASRLMNLDSLASLAETPARAVLLVIFGLLYIIGAVLTLGTLLVRNALIIVAVVLAPLAFAGGAARLTTPWVRRWIQVTLALVLSKLAIVLVFVIALGLVGDGTGIGALLSGLILLFVACMAPWACFKVLDFAGTQIATEWHRSTNGTSVTAINQGRSTATTVLRTVAPVVGGGAGAAAAGAAAAPSAGSSVVLKTAPQAAMSGSENT